MIADAGVDRLVWVRVRYSDRSVGNRLREEMPVASGQQSSDAMRQPRHRRPEDELAADDSVAAEASENGSDDIAARLQEWRMENARLGLANSESSAEDSADSPATEPSPSRGDEQPTHHRNERSDVQAVPNRGDSPPRSHLSPATTIELLGTVCQCELRTHGRRTQRPVK